jgi:O-antigen/teichoic acid export membrane protein
VARGLLAAGLPLFLSGYLQNVALGFDRVILLERGGVTTLGYYAPAVAALSAMAVVPGAVASYVYPRMSYALGQGCSAREVRAMAAKAAALSLAAGTPALLVGWLAAPAVIARFFPAYLVSVPAVRWSLLAGCLTGLSPAVQALGSLKAWRRLAAYVALLLAARWTFPWLLSGRMEPLEGVALGNACAAAATGALALGLLLVAGAAPRAEGPAA